LYMQQRFLPCQARRPKTISSTVFAASAICLSSGICVRKKRKMQSLIVRFAIVERDSHTKAVQQWVDTMIVGMGFCPWAKPASEANAIRVVTSNASSGEGVLVDLRDEAAKLTAVPLHPARGVPVTTLLVCPHVAEWGHFDAFSQFGTEVLDCGDALVSEFGCKIVSFHPHSQASNQYGVSAGDEVVACVDGNSQLCGTVLRDNVGNDEAGTKLLEVQFFGEAVQSDFDDMSSGGLMIQPLADLDRVEVIAETAITQLLGRDALQDAESCRSVLGRAPRPVLHLLRAADLEAVDNEVAQETLDLNEKVMNELGIDEFDQCLHRCG